MNLRKLREQLSADNIKKILKDVYGVEPIYEDNKSMRFETCCHNHLGKGSHKLYYYIETGLFHCYTECNESFDIFELIMKIEAVAGNDINLSTALNIAGYDPFYEEETKDNINDELATLTLLNNNNGEKTKFKRFDSSFLEKRYLFDTRGLKIWEEEGISFETMKRYRIRFDTIDNCIIIPQFNENGAVVGVRKRNLEPEAPIKYQPIKFNGVEYNAESSQLLYGLFQNLDAIKRHKTCIIFESEKSVLKLDKIMGRDNISVAVFGQNISQRHIELLFNAGVSDVIVAFDADYIGSKERLQKELVYRKKVKKLSTFFNVSLIMDDQGLLGYKDSPVDKGAEVFYKLLGGKINL